jgi:hypothetical protein
MLAVGVLQPVPRDPIADLVTFGLGVALSIAALLAVFRLFRISDDIRVIRNAVLRAERASHVPEEKREVIDLRTPEEKARRKGQSR